MTESEFKELVDHFKTILKEDRAEVAKNKLKELIGLDITVDQSNGNEELHILN